MIYGANNRLTFIDLFAGAGGLSEGFVSSGYRSVAHVEMDMDACNTLKTRECYHYLKSVGLIQYYFDYLRKTISREELYKLVPGEILDSVICETMSDDTMPSIFRLIDKAMAFHEVSQVDLVLGGPPCQAYSTVGRSRKNMDGDPRNTLYKLYFQTIEKYKPTMFVFENVPGLITAGNGDYLNAIITGFRSMGYELEQRVLNASDYGVLQNRRRIIIIGWKEGSGHYFPELEVIKHHYLVRDLFEDLPELKPGEEKISYKDNLINDYLREMGIRNENDILTWHMTRTNKERDREIYRLAIKAWNYEHKRIKYTDIPDEIATHKNRSSFLDRFKVVAADQPATQTMVAHISKDGHYYIHPDYNQARSISVREAARIQSFPDDFFFEGSRTSAFRQIGNAVPPQLARVIALSMKTQFKGDKNGE